MEINILESEIRHLQEDVHDLKKDKEKKLEKIVKIESDIERVQDAQRRQETVMQMLLSGLDRIEQTVNRMPLLVGFIIFIIYITDHYKTELIAIMSAIFGRF